MARRKSRLLESQSAREIFQNLSFAPLEELVRLYQSEIPLTTEEAASPFIQGLLGNYDLLPAGDGKWCLKLNVARRIELLRTSIPYLHPQLRSTECKVEEDKEIHVTILTAEAMALQSANRRAASKHAPRVGLPDPPPLLELHNSGLSVNEG
jgi:hypothetical protein